MSFENYCGYLADKTAMRGAKISAQLDKRIKYNDKVANYAEFIIDCLFVENRTPYVFEEKYGYRDVYRLGVRRREYCELPTPKKSYGLKDSNEGDWYKINKTQYDFAVWIAENFSSLEECESADNAEGERLAAIEAEKIRKEKQAEEQERLLQEEKEAFERKLVEKAVQLVDTNINQLRREIFSKCYPDMPERSLSNANALKLYSLAENITLGINSETSKKAIADWLHNDNKGSIKFFEKITGVKLPKTYGKRIEMIESLSANDIHLMEVKQV